MQKINQTIDELNQKALKAKSTLLSAKTKEKNQALEMICHSVHQQRKKILRANQVDLENASKNNLEDALIDRLKLNDQRIGAMIQSVEKIIALEDPVGSINQITINSHGFKIGQMRSPLGVIFIIYESRPNVTLDAAALCLKSSNVSILRGGKEAIQSNVAIYQAIQAGLDQSKLDNNSVLLVEDLSYQLVQELIKADQFIDVVIPRGGKSLIAAIKNNSSIPVISHLDGNCHIFVDQSADLKMAEKIVFNAKTRRYGVCNALETLLVDQKVSEKFLPAIAKRFEQKAVEIRGCERTKKILKKLSIKCQLATEDDYFREFLAPIIAIRTVDDINQAIEHINHYGSNHSDAIVTENLSNSEAFLTRVDSSSVMVNISTAFADGFEYGLGAEIGISTNKLHVRGPVGLVGLTNQKYIVLGSGQIRK